VKPSERGREERGRPKTGSPAQSSGPNLALRDGQGFRIRPLFSAGAKGVESGVKERQNRRPFHSECDLLRLISLYKGLEAEDSEGTFCINKARARVYDATRHGSP
jgi:hypothetical protein